MTKRKSKMKAEIGLFLRQYARRAPRSGEPNDRGYSRKLAQKIKRMRPEDFDELANGTDDDDTKADTPIL